jgi:uncharacterized protein YqfB (UPF0267 family)
MQITPLRVASALLLSTLFTGCSPTTPPPVTPPPAPIAAAPSHVPPPVAMSVASTAPAVLPPELKFSGESIKAIQAGTKTATVRKGVRSFPAGLIKAISTNAEPIVLQNVVTTSKKMSELTDADAKLNGSDSLDELKADLSRDYPGIEPEDVVTVITFKLAASDAGK